MSDDYIPVALKRAVYERAQGCCKYCRNQAKYVGPFSFDHVQPRSKSGLTTLDNLALACALCNSYKSNLVTSRGPGPSDRYFGLVVQPANPSVAGSFCMECGHDADHWPNTDRTRVGDRVAA